MMKTLKAIYSSSVFQMKQSFGRPTFRFCVIMQPILYGFIMFCMFKNTDKQNFLAYAVLGTGLLNLWSTICFSSAGDIERERHMGTLELISAVPTKFEIIILGKVIGNTLWGVISMAIAFIFAVSAFELTVDIDHPLIFLGVFLLSMISFVGVAMLLSTAFTLSRKSRILMNVLEYPIFILCGILFPMEILPLWTRPLSYVLSPTWGVKLMRMSILGINNYRVFSYYTIILTAITIIYFATAFYLFSVISKKTRINATLGVS